MEQYLCPCGYIYNELLGCPTEGISPGTRFSELPESWRCPVCGLAKDYFGKRLDAEEPTR